MYVVTVVFAAKPEHLDDFLPAMNANAQASLEREEGCHQFDVCQDPENPNVIFLYELYTDRAAFDVHLASEHFQDFNALTADWVADKQVRTFERSWP